MFEDEIIPAVQRGAMLLDEQVPLWTTRIDVANLELANCARCVLGQLFGTYSTGIASLNLWNEETYGFDMPEYFLDELEAAAQVDAFWTELRDEWIAAIKQRLDAGVRF